MMYNGIRFDAEGRALATAAATIAKHGVSRGSGVVPILANVRIMQDGGTLTLEGTNLSYAVRLTMPVGGDGQGEVCVSAEQLAALLARMADGSAVNVKWAAPEGCEGAALALGRLQVVTSQATAALPVLSTTDFPRVQWDADADSAVTIMGDELRALLAAGACAMATDDARPIMGGVHLSRRDEALRAASSDGYRAVWCETTEAHGLDRGLFDGGMVLHRESVAVLRGLLANTHQVRFSRAANAGGRLVAESADGAWAAILALVDGEYPPLERVWPARDGMAEATVDPGDLKRALALVSAALEREASPMVRLSIASETGVEVSTTARPDGADASTRLRAAVAVGWSGAATVTVNHRYLTGLLDGLAATGADDVTLCITPDRPATPPRIDARPSDSLEVSAVLMPMVVNS